MISPWLVQEHRRNGGQNHEFTLPDLSCRVTILFPKEEIQYEH
jgi:hypothetical protein